MTVKDSPTQIPQLAPTRNHSTTLVTPQPTPTTAQLPPPPIQGDYAGNYQRALLNIRTGDLTFFCADWRIKLPIPRPGEDRTLWDEQHPGSIPDYSPGVATKPVPDLLVFHIDTWTNPDRDLTDLPTPAWVYMTREQGDTFVASLAPLAQHLINNLFQVPGTNDLEWSAESVAAAKAIRTACGRNQQGPTNITMDTAGLVNFGDATTEAPEMIHAEWAELDNHALDDHAETLNRFAGLWHPQLKEKFGAPYRDGSGVGLNVYGARSWIYTYRAHEADNRPVVDATTWFTDPTHTLGWVSANHDTEALATFVQQERTRAAQQGVKLVGVERIAHVYRDELRARIVEEDLNRAREAVERLQQAKATRAGLLAQIIGWQDCRYHSDNDAELGRRAGLTRQAVNQLRKAVTGEDPGDTN